MDIEDTVEVFARGYALSRSVTHTCGVRNISGVWVLRDEAAFGIRERSSELIALDPTLQQVVDAATQAAASWTLSLVEPGATDSMRFRGPLEFSQAGFRRGGTEPLFVADPASVASHPGPITRVSSWKLAEATRRANRGRRLIPDSEVGVPDSPFRLFVARTDTQVLGWVVGIEVGTGSYICSLFVLPGFRRRGVGGALMSAIAADNAARGVTASVLTSSSAGSAIYRRLGFSQVATVHLLRPSEERKRSVVLSL